MFPPYPMKRSSHLYRSRVSESDERVKEGHGPRRALLLEDHVRLVAVRVAVHSIHLSRLGGVVPCVVGAAVSWRPALVEHPDLVVLNELNELLQVVERVSRVEIIEKHAERTALSAGKVVGSTPSDCL